jgi:hypothetical protein
MLSLKHIQGKLEELKIPSSKISNELKMAMQDLKVQLEILEEAQKSLRIIRKEKGKNEQEIKALKGKEHAIFLEVNKIREEVAKKEMALEALWKLFQEKEKFPDNASAAAAAPQVSSATATAPVAKVAQPPKEATVTAESQFKKQQIAKQIGEKEANIQQAKIKKNKLEDECRQIQNAQQEKDFHKLQGIEDDIAEQENIIQTMQVIIEQLKTQSHETVTSAGGAATLTPTATPNVPAKTVANSGAVNIKEAAEKPRVTFVAPLAVGGTIKDKDPHKTALRKALEELKNTQAIKIELAVNVDGGIHTPTFEITYKDTALKAKLVKLFVNVGVENLDPSVVKSHFKPALRSKADEQQRSGGLGEFHLGHCPYTLFEEYPELFAFFNFNSVQSIRNSSEVAGQCGPKQVIGVPDLDEEAEVHFKKYQGLFDLIDKNQPKLTAIKGSDLK